MTENKTQDTEFMNMKNSENLTDSLNEDYVNQNQDRAKSVVATDKKQPAQPHIWKKKVPMKNVKVIQDQSGKIPPDITQSLLQGSVSNQSEPAKQTEIRKIESTPPSKPVVKGILGLLQRPL